MPFDQLKEDAETKDDEKQQEESGSDADIEVLGDGEVPDTGADGGSAEPGAAQEAQPTQSAGETAADTATGQSADGGETVEVLRRIEEQNQEILDVLRGIKRSLE